MKIRKVLVAVEFLAPDSDAAVEMAATLARPLGAGVLLLHVYPPQDVLAGIVPGASDEDLALDKKGAQDGLESIASLLRAQGIAEVEVLVSPGQMADEILRHALEEDVDLIVMGTHGRTGISRLLVGSVAASVMTKARCLVVTVHAPEGAHAAHSS